MDAITKFRQDLRQGRKLIGPGITFGEPAVTDALASSSDFVWIDLEHGLMSPESLLGHLLAAKNHQIPSIVRVTAGVTHLIKPVLDSGADGIIVPQVRLVEEVKNAVSDCRYPPVGRRGFGPRIPSNYGRQTGEEYVAAANENVFFAVMIETAEALEAIDEIVRLPGLDSVVIGPADLTLALGEGRNVSSARVQKAIERIVAAANSAGKFIGAGMGPDVEFALHLARLGVQWLQVGQDCDLLVKQMDAIQADFKRSWLFELDSARK